VVLLCIIALINHYLGIIRALSLGEMLRANLARNNYGIKATFCSDATEMPLFKYCRNSAINPAF
jgi:hypothetical protein